MEPDEFSGIIELDIRIVLCRKVNIYKAEILPKTLSLSSYTKALFSHSRALDISSLGRVQDNLQLQNT